MVKKILIIAAVAAVFAAGCRRKTPSDGENGEEKQKQQQEKTTTGQEKKEKQAGQEPEPPSGMARIEGVGDETIFIRKEPVTVQEYVDFRESTGRPVPDRFSGPGVDTDRPVTGLSLRQARRLATWMLGQLPSAREWQAAPNSVASGTYPWRIEQGEDTPRPGAKVYIVKHYRPGSEGEQQARQRREKMLSELLQDRREEVQKLRKQVTSDLQDIESNWQEVWQQYKTAFFNHLELQAQAARRQARKTRKQTVATILNRVRERKIQNLIRLQQSDASSQEMQQAVEKYRNFLSTQVQQVQDKRKALEEQMGGMSDRVLNMKQKVENAGSARLKPVLQSIRQKLEDVPQEFDDIEAALE
ncbi:MAG: SUMF1/EgtB/PvdO family nonheme iron enzyme, partial [Planctomycetota bacterium]